MEIIRIQFGKGMNKSLYEAEKNTGKEQPYVLGKRGYDTKSSDLGLDG